MEKEASQPNPDSRGWTAVQTYSMAAVCLLIGVLLGYLVRGSAKPVADASTQPQMAVSSPMPKPANAPHPAMGQQKMPTLDEMKRIADKQVEPMLAKLKTDPKNVDLLNKVALTYKTTHQFKEAIIYFQKALEVDSKNVAIRTDMASCLYFTGDVDGALAELKKSLTYDPKHAGTLLNIGIIKWQGKKDVPGAVAAWQTVLKRNPNFPQKEMVQHLITQAQQQRNSALTSTLPKG